jgi:hypothetical protein
MQVKRIADEKQISTLSARREALLAELKQVEEALT